MLLIGIERLFRMSGWRIGNTIRIPSKGFFAKSGAISHQHFTKRSFDRKRNRLLQPSRHPWRDNRSVWQHDDQLFHRTGNRELFAASSRDGRISTDNLNTGKALEGVTVSDLYDRD
jgi:hypothetical protein